VRVGDVLRAGREDVEGEQAAREKELVRRPQRPPPILLGAQVEVRAKRRRDELDALAHRRVAEVTQPQVEEVPHAGQFGPLRADLEHSA
jgi:hypothetical protein